ncbi:MAG: hypothetical protein ACE5J3_05700 [Methanosarcinales archaeon]
MPFRVGQKELLKKAEWLKEKINNNWLIEGPSVKKHEEKPFYLLTEEEANKKGAHIIGLIANISLLLMALVIFLMFKR